MSRKGRGVECPKENISHGDYGPVRNEEMLARFVFHAEFIDEDGFLRRSALIVKELLKTDGWSLCRQEYIDDMDKELEKRSKNGDLRGYALARTECIRQVKDSNSKRPICIIDNPIEGNPAHADDDPAHALAQKARDYEENEVREFRNKLLKKFSKVIIP